MNIAKICVFHVFLILLDQCYFGQYIENCLKPNYLGQLKRWMLIIFSIPQTKILNLKKKMFKIINIWYLCTNILFRFCTECQKGLSFQGRLRFEPVRFLSRQLIVTSQYKKIPEYYTGQKVHYQIQKESEDIQAGGL